MKIFHLNLTLGKIILIKSITNLNFKDDFCLATDLECIGKNISNLEYKTKSKNYAFKSDLHKIPPMKKNDFHVNQINID